jgi:hypothetical protein
MAGPREGQSLTDYASKLRPAEEASQVVARNRPTVQVYENQTGNLKQVAPEAAEQGFAHGDYNLVKAGGTGLEISVALADGQTGTVPPESVQQVIQSGGHVISGAQRRGAELEKEHGGLTGAYLATQAGALRGLTSGISDELLMMAPGLVGASSAEDLQDRMQFLRERHGLASGAGEVGGMAAQALLTGGGIGGAAENLASKGVAQLGEGFAAKAAQKAIPMAVRGAAEGAQLGYQEAITDRALQDHALTAEKLISSMGHQALIGGAAGGAFGLLGATLGELGAKAKGALASDASKAVAAAEPRPGDIEKVAAGVLGHEPEKGIGEAYAKLASSAAGGGDDIIRTAGAQNWTAEGRAARKALLEAPEIRAEAARAVKTHVDDILSASSAITEEAKGKLKLDYVRKAIGDADIAATSRKSLEMADGLQTAVKEMLADPNTYGLRSSLKNMDQLFKSQVDGVFSAKGAAEQFVALDEMKRALGRWTKASQAVEKSPDALKLLQGRATRTRLEELYERMRTGLQDESVWGKAALDQQQINGAWAKQIEAEGRFHRALTTEVGVDPANPWRKVRGVDPGKADSYVNSLTNPKNDLTHKAVRDYVSSTRDLAGTMAEAYEMPAAKLAEVRKLHAAADAFDATLSKTEKTVALSNQLEELLKREGASGAGSLVGLAAGGLAAGGPIGGLLGAALGAVGKAISRPGHTLLQLAQVERLVSQADAKMAGAVSGFFAKRAGTEAGASVFTELNALRRSTAGARTVVAERSNQRATFAERSKEIRELSANPEALQARLEASTKTLSERAPNVAASVALTTTQGVAFLQSKMPVTAAPDPLRPGSAPPHPSETQVSKWLRYQRAVNDPITVLDDLKRGRVSPEGAEALRVVYPRMYEQAKGMVLAQIQSATSAPTRQQRLQLGMAFELPEPALAPAAVRSRQQAYAAADKELAEKPPRRPASATSKAVASTATRSEQLEMGAAQ